MMATPDLEIFVKATIIPLPFLVFCPNCECASWRRPSHEEITSKLEPWTLACAVGASNGTIYASGQRGLLNLKTWLRLVNRDGWQHLTGASMGRIDAAIRVYVRANQHKHMNAVLREEEQRRGLQPSITIGPGESVRFEIKGAR